MHTGTGVYQSALTRTLLLMSPHICSGEMSPVMVGKRLFDDMMKKASKGQQTKQERWCWWQRSSRREDETG